MFSLIEQSSSEKMILLNSVSRNVFDRFVPSNRENEISCLLSHVFSFFSLSLPSHSFLTTLLVELIAFSSYIVVVVVVVQEFVDVVGSTVQVSGFKFYQELDRELNKWISNRLSVVEKIIIGQFLVSIYSVSLNLELKTTHSIHCLTERAHMLSH